MLKIEVRKMQIPCLCMEGECIEIAAEVGVAIGAMFNKIRMVNPQAAMKFRAGVMAATMADAPTWEHFDLPGGVTQCVTVPKPMKDYRFLGVCSEQELLEENRRLQGIVDGFASKVEEQMVRIARECNGAGGSEAADRAVELSLLQAEPAAMDRECIIQAEPVVGGWRVDWIRVGDREIYRREDGPDGED